MQAAVTYGRPTVNDTLVVAFSSLAGTLGECSIIHPQPELFEICLFEVEINSRILIPLFKARISPQWLSELRRLWLSVP